MAIEGTVDLPVAGAVKKQHLIVGGAVVAGIVGYAWWKYFRAGGDGPPGELDPGFADYTGGLQTGGPGTTTPGLPWEPDDDDEEDPDDLPPKTNAAWTQRGVDWMQNLGFDPQLVAKTLGKYLARVPVTQNEADIIRTVEGAIGKPPVGEFRIIMVGTPPNPDPDPDPDPDPPPAAAPTHVSVTLGANVYDWVDALSRQYPQLGLNFVKMFGMFNGDPSALNPFGRKYMKWRNTSPNKTPIWDGNWSGRNPPLGIPQQKIR